MPDDTPDLVFTGEYFVPGESKERIEADHMERYRFACGFAKGKRALDIACGVGYAGPILMQARATAYTGVDINPQLVDYAKTHYGRDGIDYHVGNICTFDLGQRYDLITCFETIEHVSTYQEAIRQLYTLLAPGGTLLISSPNRPITSPGQAALSDKPRNKFHTQEFVPDELKQLLTAQGFTVQPDAVYGQRLRRVYSVIWLNKLAKLFGNPNATASPKVQPLAGKAPRYFLIVAHKPAATS